MPVKTPADGQNVSNGQPLPPWSKPPFAPMSRRRTVIRAALTFLLLTLIAFMLSLSASADARRVAGERFAFKAAEAQYAIKQRLLAYEQVLRGGVALFSATDFTVTREMWHIYVAGLAIERNYPGIQGIGFSERVLARDREAHVARIRAAGFPDYRIRPEGARGEYTSIVFLEPFDWRNKRAFGFDMFSEPVRHEAMTRARDQGQPAVSGKVILVQETKEGIQNGFLMYLPVYRPGASVGSVAQRRAALLGYVYAPFRMRDLMQGIFSAEQIANVRLQIFDGPTADDAALLYDSITGSDAAPYVPAFAIDQQLRMNGRTWTISYTSLPNFDASMDTRTPQLILFGGAIVSLLLTAVIWSLSANRERAKQLAKTNEDLSAEIAERTKLAAELTDAKNAAETANRAKSMFLANMSHELRTPLNAVLGYAQMLRRGRDLSEWQAGAINTIQQSGEHLLRLISDILDLSKIEAAKLELSCSVVSLPDLLSGVAAAVRLKAEEKSLNFVFSMPHDLAQWVQADEKRLRQVLLNLLGNAVKFTDRGQVTFRVDLVPADETRVRLRFAIEDTGIGIAGDKLQAIFEPFEQVSDRQRQSAGTGLGLSITRDLIRMMGSEVSVESTIGSGSRFCFDLELPLAEAGRAETLNSAAVCGYVGARRSVLIVDDIPANRALLSDALSSVGFTVREAVNGKEGLDQTTSDPPDLILMDVMMPVMDGLEATRRIRAFDQPKQPSIIAISASVTTDDRARVLAAGADAFIGKPIDPPQLFREIGNLLALQWIKDEQEPSDPQAGAAFVAPPQDEIRFLRELARAGNMRRIKARARELAALDGTFEPFANRLLQLADDFDSKAILDLVSEHSDQQRGAA